MEFILFIIAILALLIGGAIWLTYNDYKEKKKNHRRKIYNRVHNAYEGIIKDCVAYSEALPWINTIEERFKNLMVMEEYKTIQPYDFFPLNGPMSLYFRFTCGIAVDKDRKLRLVPQQFDYEITDDKDGYLSECYAYGENLAEFIKECGERTFEYKLKEEKKKRIDEQINR